MKNAANRALTHRHAGEATDPSGSSGGPSMPGCLPGSARLPVLGAIALMCSLVLAPAHAQVAEGGFEVGIDNPLFKAEAIAFQAALDAARRTCNRAVYDEAMRKLQRLLERAERRAQLTAQEEAKICVAQGLTIGDYLEAVRRGFGQVFGGPPPVLPSLYPPACPAAQLAADNARRDVSSLRQVLRYEQARGFDCSTSPLPRVSDGGTAPAPALRVSAFVQGGGTFGKTSFHLDPGAFVPINETIAFDKGVVGVGFELMPVSQRLFMLGVSGVSFLRKDNFRSFDAPPVSGEVRRGANWSATGYVGFPQVIAQPPVLPFAQALIVTPTFGITYQEDTLKSFQSLNTGVGVIDNTFEKSFGRVGATFGLNFDIPAGPITYGLTTGLTVLPETTVRGVSSLGLPAEAQINSQTSFFLGARIGVVLSDPAPRDRVGVEWILPR